jgi:hypothetical protein
MSPKRPHISPKCSTNENVLHMAAHKTLNFLVCYVYSQLQRKLIYANPSKTFSFLVYVPLKHVWG